MVCSTKPQIQENSGHLVTSALLILTPRLHLLNALPSPLPSLLRLGTLAPQPNRNLLPHLPILEQHPNVRPSRNDLLPERLAHHTLGITLRNYSTALVPRPRDLVILLHSRSQINVNGHIGVTSSSDLSSVLGDFDGGERK